MAVESSPGKRRHHRAASDFYRFLLSEEQIASYTASFQFLDKNGDGQISTAELAEAFRAIGHAVSLREVQQMVKDVNGHGDFITHNEFLVIMGRKNLNSESTQQQQLEAAFRAFDQDDDGLISAADLQSVLASFGHHASLAEVQSMIAAVNPEQKNDGKISLDEFMTLL